MSEGKQYIIEAIKSMSGSRNPYQIFKDWCEMFALAVANSCTFFKDKVWQAREEEYLRIWQQYGPEEHEILIHMCGELINEFDKEPSDHLGDIFMQSGCGNKITGQFFTPFHVSSMVGKLMTSGDEDIPCIVDEPSCGAGGMIIAKAMALKDKGINYQRAMRVTAQDLDWLAVYMTYIQLSFMGINAVVIQGDTLIEPGSAGKDEARIFRTPANRGALI
jgi:type I restriction-modification system DNA methylase subunit